MKSKEILKDIWRNWKYVFPISIVFIILAIYYKPEMEPVWFLFMIPIVSAPFWTNIIYFFIKLLRK